MSDYLLNHYLPALASTLAIELGVAVLIGFWSARQLGAVALANLITHPALHVVLWTSGWSQPASLVALEAAVFLAEGLLLMRLLKLPAANALLASAAMNATSAVLGLALFP
jgi:hypothetical protein